MQLEQLLVKQLNNFKSEGLIPIPGGMLSLEVQVVVPEGVVKLSL